MKQKPFSISRTAIFHRLVGEAMGAVPTTFARDSTCAEVVRRMAVDGASNALVTGEGGRVLGVVTEQDVVSRVTYLLPGETPVERVMTSPVTVVRDTDPVYRAIATMRRRRLRHLPVLDNQDRLVGSLDLDDALAYSLSGLLDLVDRLTHEQTFGGLRAVKQAQVELADALLRERIPAPEIQRLLTDVNNDIYRRILKLVLGSMAEEGWGDPPLHFAAIVMGSGGRGESFLFPDQDNGFVLADYSDGRHRAIDTWFIELAERMTARLDHVGIPLCRGHVMATNPLWRKSISQWRAQLSGWLKHPSVATLRLADIFFDFCWVYGDLGLVQQLRNHLTASAKGRFEFLRAMQKVQQDHGVALGPFARLTTERASGPHRGQLNLKYHGLLPLVEAVRLLALRGGVSETATLERIASLHRLGILNHDEQDYLSGAFVHLTGLVLRQQVSDFKQGFPVGGYVALAALSEREKDMLVDALQAIRTLQRRIHTEFTGEIF